MNITIIYYICQYAKEVIKLLLFYFGGEKMVFEVYNPKQSKSKNNSTDKTFIYLSEKLKERLEMLKKIAVEDFKKAIWINVYVRYKPVEYVRTYSMLNAVSVSEVKQVGNSLYFDVYIDVFFLIFFF